MHVCEAVAVFETGIYRGCYWRYGQEYNCHRAMDDTMKVCKTEHEIQSYIMSIK